MRHTGCSDEQVLACSAFSVNKQQKIVFHQILFVTHLCVFDAEHVIKEILT